MSNLSAITNSKHSHVQWVAAYWARSNSNEKWKLQAKLILSQYHPWLLEHIQIPKKRLPTKKHQDLMKNERLKSGLSKYHPSITLNALTPDSHQPALSRHDEKRPNYPTSDMSNLTGTRFIPVFIGIYAHTCIHGCPNHPKDTPTVEKSPKLGMSTCENF